MKKYLFVLLIVPFVFTSCKKEEIVTDDTQHYLGMWLSNEIREYTYEPDGTLTRSWIEETKGYAFLELRADGSYLSNYFMKQGRYDFKSQFTQIYFLPSIDSHGEFTPLDQVVICDLELVSDTEIRIRYTDVDQDGYITKHQFYFIQD